MVNDAGGVYVEEYGKSLPIDPQGGVLVPYRGPAGSFPYVSANDIMSGTVEDPDKRIERLEAPESDKALILGENAWRFLHSK